MLRTSLIIIISLIFSINTHAQDCENYFLYQQDDSLTFTFEGFMVEPSQALFNWNFGDGTTATGKLVTHTFPPQGSNIYEVCLYTETYDTAGNPCYDTSCQNVTVGDPPGCVAFFFTHESQGNPLTWYFTDFSSGNPTSWSWDFGDGNTSTLQDPFNTYAVPGTYQVCLTIHDTIDNCQDEYCEEIIVNAPLGDCESDFTYTSNDLVTFDFSGYMTDTTQLALGYHWDFGDGNAGTGQNITHTYDLGSASFVTVCLTTIYVFPTGDTCEHETCKEVYVGTAINCQALFEWGFSAQPLTVDFTDLSTGGPTSWYWDFGDSTHSTLPNPSHTFPREDMYDVCLTIINDSNQCTSTFCSEIHVTNVPPPVDCYNTITHFPGGDIYTFDFQGEAYSNTINVSQTSTFTWNLGDGNTATGQNITHTFGAAGTYVITLTTVSILNGTDTCAAYSHDSIFISDISYCIGGFVYLDSVTHPDQGHVHLMSYDAANNMLVMVESTLFDNAGHYLFEDVNHGNGLTYYVQADLTPQSAHYGQYVPTYHYDDIHWINAQLAIEEECPPVSHYDIMMQEATAASPGTGSISGVVFSADSKDIIENVEILLLNEETKALMYSYTDENGRFNFNSLADGSYYVYPEIVGIETSGFLVTLNEEIPSVDLIIIVGDGTAYLSVDEYSLITVMGDIYPNPANTQVNISLSVEKAIDAEITVYNQLGQQMFIQKENLSKGINKLELNISSLPESVYYLRMHAEDSKPLMRRFIKVR